MGLCHQRDCAATAADAEAALRKHSPLHLGQLCINVADGCNLAPWGQACCNKSKRAAMEASMLQYRSQGSFPGAVSRHLNADGVPDAAHELEVRAVHLARALPAPQEVTAAVVPANPHRYDCSEGWQTQLRAWGFSSADGPSTRRSCLLRVWCTYLKVGMIDKAVAAQRSARQTAQPPAQDATLAPLARALHFCVSALQTFDILLPKSSFETRRIPCFTSFPTLLAQFQWTCNTCPGMSFILRHCEFYSCLRAVMRIVIACVRGR